MITAYNDDGGAETVPRRRRGLRFLVATGALGLGFALVPSQIAGANVLEPEPAFETPADPIEDADAVLCYWEGRSYSVGSIVKMADNVLYRCNSDGTWVQKA